MNARELVVYVDVDDTLVRSVGSKRFPIPAVVEHVRALHAAGVTLYCWSAGGAEYARTSAAQLGLEAAFLAFLPKPHVFIDDQPPAEWPRCRVVHPIGIGGATLDDHLRALSLPRVP